MFYDKMERQFIINIGEERQYKMKFFAVFCLILSILEWPNEVIGIHVYPDPSGHNHHLTCTLDDSKPRKGKVPVLDETGQFKELKDAFNLNKSLALLLDFDGTLAEINKTHTNYTVLTTKTKSLLNIIANNPNIFTAFISGRNKKDLKEKIGLINKTYSGNHGLEIEYEDRTRHDYELPMEMQESLQQMLNDLKDKVEVNGSWVEDKGLSATYYYRNVADELKENLTNEARSIIKSYNFIVQEGRQLIEGKPPVNWQKGEAAIYILKHKFGENWCNNLNVIFIGDDNTDEDAMKILQDMAITFRIHHNENLLTYATYRLPKRDVVDYLLEWITKTFVRI